MGNGDGDRACTRGGETAGTREPCLTFLRRVHNFNAPAGASGTGGGGGGSGRRPLRTLHSMR